MASSQQLREEEYVCTSREDEGEREKQMQSMEKINLLK